MIAFQKRICLNDKDFAQTFPILSDALKGESDLLDGKVSSYLKKLITLLDKGYEVLGKDEFRSWSYSKIPALLGHKPIEIIHSETGIDKVQDVLGRIEYGVYS